ncbi:hypothetical protein BpHYR1_034365 [Brachionus plicatilis]|uniref:Uncharacterized protein n=1 Tax=Brachionus plicatilis TaxID=10195 RepID=A0A3M7Q6A8_BRAPC|nr:hypothetical protein BpHYR1_034365 [Brachionus plicatilis]
MISSVSDLATKWNIDAPSVTTINVISDSIRLYVGNLILNHFKTTLNELLKFNETHFLEPVITFSKLKF